MNYKEATDWLDETTIGMINALPKIQSLLEVNAISKVMNDLLDKHNLICKSLKPKEEYAYDLFNDDNIYSVAKLKDSYIKVFMSLIELYKELSYTFNECGENMEAYLNSKLREEKFKKI